MTALKSSLVELLTGETLNQALMREQRREAARKLRLALMHDVYNPLLGILGNLELLEAEDLAPEVRVCHRDMKECAQRIDFAIKELTRLDMSILSPSPGSDSEARAVWR